MPRQTPSQTVGPYLKMGLIRGVQNKLVSDRSEGQRIRIEGRVLDGEGQPINDAMLEMFASFRPGFRFEIGVNVNHPVEFWPETVASIRRLQSIGVRFYNQHPLLKGVNDDLETLIEHYGLLRDHDIEAHYLFHAIPMRGMSHHRTSVDRGLELATAISSCGAFSGRAKPRYAVLSDIGKIVLYHDSIVERRPAEQSLLLRSGFNYDDRMKWNPSWKKPESVVVLNDGSMLTWYLDGTDETVEELAAAHAS